MRSLWLKVPRFLLWRLLKRSSFECSEGIALKRLRKKKHALLRKSRRINPYLGCCGFWWGSTGSVQTQLDHHGPLSPGQTRLLVPSLVPVKGANLSCFVNNFKGLSNKLLDGLEIFLCSVRLLLQSVKSHEYLVESHLQQLPISRNDKNLLVSKVRVKDKSLEVRSSTRVE